MAKKIFIEVDFGLKGVERRDLFVYIDEKLAESFFDISYNDIFNISSNFQDKFPDAEIEISATGLDCCGKSYNWKLDKEKN